MDPGLYHFNMGTMLLKKGELSFGRYHLELAIKNGYYTTESMKNLESSRVLLGVDQFEESGTLSQISNILYASPLDFSLFLSLLILVVGITFWKKLGSSALKVMWIALVLTPMIFPIAALNNNFAVVIKKEQPVFEGPSEVFEKSNELPTGLKVIVKNNQDGWFKILTPERFTGWVKSNSIMLIKE